MQYSDCVLTAVLCHTVTPAGTVPQPICREYASLFPVNQAQTALYPEISVDIVYQTRFRTGSIHPQGFLPASQ